MWVQDADGKQVRIMPSQSVKIAGDFAGHLFVKAGWLKLSSPEVKPEPEKVEPANETPKPTRRKR